MIAANSASSSSYDVRISALIVGSCERTSRHTSMPEPSGSRPSRIATSGRSAGIRRVASSAEPGLADDLDVGLALEQLPDARGARSRGRRAGRPGSVSGASVMPPHRTDRAAAGTGPGPRRAGTLVPAADAAAGAPWGPCSTTTADDHGASRGRSRRVAAPDRAARVPAPQHPQHPAVGLAVPGRPRAVRRPPAALPVADPTGRELVISCGAALHHARVAARALGWAPTVRRFPGPSAPRCWRRSRLATAPRRAHRPTCAAWRSATPTGAGSRRGRSPTSGSSGWPRRPAGRNRRPRDPRRHRAVRRRAPHQSRPQRPGTRPGPERRAAAWLDRRRGDGPDRSCARRPRRTPCHPRFPAGALEDSDRDVDGTDGLIVLAAVRGRPRRRGCAPERDSAPCGWTPRERPVRGAARPGGRGRRDPRRLQHQVLGGTFPAAPGASGLAADQPQRPRAHPATDARQRPAAVTERPAISGPRAQPVGDSLL